MNPATVKKILGEKSIIAMYRDCLKVVPLMNPRVILKLLILAVRDTPSNKERI